MLSIGLFVATSTISLGVLGLFSLVFGDSRYIFLLAGIASILYLELYLFRTAKRYFSGVSTAVCWLACLYFLVGLSSVTNISESSYFLLCGIISAGFAIRYVSKVSTFVSLSFFTIMVLNMLKPMTGLRGFTPLILMVLFVIVYFLSKYLKDQRSLRIWYDNFRLLEGLSLLAIALTGNRLCNQSLLKCYHLEGCSTDDARLIGFYWLTTILVPAIYLFFAVRKRDVLLIRMALLELALLAYTIKYFYSLNHPEFTLTLAGLVLLILSAALNKYLAKERFGFTRNKLLEEQWFHANAEALVIAESAAVTAPQTYSGGGGKFGGGGADGQY